MLVLLDGKTPVDASIRERQVAHILGTMAKTKSLSTHGSTQDYNFAAGEDAWNMHAFVDALKVIAPELSWPSIMLHLDQPFLDLGRINEKGLDLIIQAFRRGCNEPFPASTFLREWKNSAAQLEIIRACLVSTDEVQEALLLGAGRGGACTSQEASDRLYASAWSSAELINVMLMLSEKQGRAEVEPLFESGLREHADSLLLGLAQCWPKDSLLYTETLDMAFRRSTEQRAAWACKTTMNEMWAISQTCYAHCLEALFRQDRNAETLQQAYELATMVDGLQSILSMRLDGDFLLELSSFADSQGALRFTDWLQGLLEKDADRIAEACTRLVCRRLHAPRAPLLHYSNLGLQHVDEMLRLLSNSSADSAVKAAQRLQNGAARPRLLGGAPPPVSAGPGGPGNAGMALPGGMPPTAGAIPPQPGGVPMQGDGSQMPVGQPQQQSALFAPEIEEEANSHFQRIYTSELEIDKVIQMLKGFKTSNNQREQQVFACMIHNLFDEYRFFPRYPERELLITGKLFGSLIQHQLVSSITLGIALRYVLEALRKPFRTNMFKFGMCALEQFKSRLSEWPQYCHHINQIAHIRESHKDIIDFMPTGRPPTGAAQDGAAQAAPASQPQAQQPALDASARAASPATAAPSAPSAPSQASTQGLQPGAPQQQSLHFQQQMMIQSLMKQQPDAANNATGPATTASAQVIGCFVCLTWRASPCFNARDCCVLPRPVVAPLPSQRFSCPRSELVYISFSFDVHAGVRSVRRAPRRTRHSVCVGSLRRFLLWLWARTRAPAPERTAESSGG